MPPTPRFLVTGASGQLGFELCRQLGPQAIAVSRRDVDLTDVEQFRALLTRAAPQVVINAAAYTQVDRAEEEPEIAQAVNAMAVTAAAEACRACDALLVQISTDYVFAGVTDRDTPWREEDPPQPLGVYAQTKRKGEQAAAECPKHLIVRTCGLFGRRPAGSSGGNFVDTMLRLGGENRPLRVVNDQHCTPSYVPHVAEAVLFLARQALKQPEVCGLYHVTNSGATTWYDLAAEIFRQRGLQVDLTPITTEEFAAAAPRPAYSVLDTSKYHALGGPAMPSWQAGLQAYLDELADAAA